jgi:hypothetical protein
VSYEPPRLAHPGRGDSQDIIVTEKRVVPTLVDLIGASGYKCWLHLKRLEIAVDKKRSADFMAQTDSKNGTCELCGLRNGAVRSFRAIGPTRATQGIRVVGCSIHLPLLTAAAEKAVAEVADDQLLADERHAGAAAEGLVAARLSARLDSQQDTQDTQPSEPTRKTPSKTTRKAGVA